MSVGLGPVSRLPVRGGWRVGLPGSVRTSGQSTGASERPGVCLQGEVQLLSRTPKPVPCLPQTRLASPSQSPWSRLVSLPRQTRQRPSQASENRSSSRQPSTPPQLPLTNTVRLDVHIMGVRAAWQPVGAPQAQVGTRQVLVSGFIEPVLCPAAFECKWKTLSVCLSL